MDQKAVVYLLRNYPSRSSLAETRELDHIVQYFADISHAHEVANVAMGAFSRMRDVSVETDQIFHSNMTALQQSDRTFMYDLKSNNLRIVTVPVATLVGIALRKNQLG
ncbi:hypothetical protein P879_01759 [Paragonimus westermani]|uniref:Uncharacterized protein n=1 Tax=Paragonimus westermani TaxID=34504 RepID=A0A8T0D0Z2_9TREM|nr:hypothetical protein P879_01759 [Paragonimus westermani]